MIDFTAWMPETPLIISNGIIPVALMIIGILIFYRVVRKTMTTVNNEAVQALFIFILVSFIILTVTGIWFRGAEMRLVFHV